MKRLITIYYYLDKTNGKRYVGQAYNTQLRSGKEGKSYYGSRFGYEICKKGFNKFRLFILDKTHCEKEANNLEKYWIKKFNSNNILYGYNVESGGGYNRYHIAKNNFKWKTNNLEYKFYNKKDGAYFAGKIKDLCKKFTLNVPDTLYMATKRPRPDTKTIRKTVKGWLVL